MTLPPPKKRLCGISAACLLILLAGLLLLPDWMRGSDQFWYYTEIASFVDSLSASSNCIYPYFVENAYDLSRLPPVHNCYVLAWISYLPCILFGVVKGFLLANIFFTLCAALLAYLTVRKFNKSENAALFAFAGVAFFPLCFWLAFNMLQESMLMACTAAVFCPWLFFHFERKPAMIAVALALALFFILVYPIYIFVSLFILAHILFAYKKRAIIPFVLGIFLIAAAITAENLFMPSQAGILRAKGIFAVEYYRTNGIQFYFSDIYGTLPQLAVYKLGRICKDMIFTPNIAFILAILAAYLYALFLAVKRRPHFAFLFFAMSAFIAPIFGLFALHQFQMRYFIILIPVLLPALFFALRNVKEAKLKFCACSLLALFALCDVFMYLHIRRETLRQMEFADKMHKALSQSKRGDNILSLTRTSAYHAIYPRNVALVGFDNPRAADMDFQAYAKKTNCTLIFADDKILSDPRFAKIPKTEVSQFTYRNTKYFIYEID